MPNTSAPQHPWSAEIEPDAALIAGIAARHWPDLAGAEPRPFGRGWENAVWSLGEWLVRLPLRASVVPSLAREQQVLAFLAPRVPFWLPLPERVAAPDAHYPWPAWLIGRAPGRAADQLADGTDLAALARSAGEALGALHAIPPAEALANGFVDGEPYVAIHRVMRNAAAQLPVLADHVDGALLSEVARLCSQAEIERPSPPRAVPAHCDIRGEHLFVDGSRVRALIDWTDAAIADPAIDFAGLWFIGGEPLVRGAIAAYPLADPALMARARLYALAAGVTTVRYGIEAELAPERELGLRVLASASATPR